MSPAPKAVPNKRALLLSVLTLAGLLGLSIWRLSAPAPTQNAAAKSEAWELFGQTMGTTYSVKVLAGPVRVDRSELEREVKGALDVVDQSMSTYKPSSELSRFNASRSTEPVEISPGFTAVVDAALRLGHQSQGAFDITIAKVVDAWGFGPTEGHVPSDDELATLLAHTGHDKLALTGNRLRKLDPDVHIDLSAIAKGYAVDAVAERLVAVGATDFLVEVGGELSARGSRPDGSPWRVAIERPADDGRALQRVLSLRDTGIATSGDYRNFRMEGGVRVSHLIDPRTGKPIDNHLASVSVVHDQVAIADAWATALSVLGEAEGMRVATERGLPVLFIVRMTDGGFGVRLSPKFVELFGTE